MQHLEPLKQPGVYRLLPFAQTPPFPHRRTDLELINGGAGGCRTRSALFPVHNVTLRWGEKTAFFSFPVHCFGPLRFCRLSPLLPGSFSIFLPVLSQVLCSCFNWHGGAASAYPAGEFTAMSRSTPARLNVSQCAVTLPCFI